MCSASLSKTLDRSGNEMVIEGITFAVRFALPLSRIGLSTGIVLCASSDYPRASVLVKGRHGNHPSTRWGSSKFLLRW